MRSNFFLQCRGRRAARLAFGALLIAGGSLRWAAASDEKWAGVAREAEQRQAAGDAAGAETMLRRALGEFSQPHRSDDPGIIPLMSGLASVLHAEGRDLEAYAPAERAASLAEAAGNRSQIAECQTRLGLVLTGLGEYARAEPVLRRSLALYEQEEGPQALHTAVAENNLAALYSDTGRFAMAESQQRRVLPIYEKLAGADSAAFAAALDNMYTILASQRRAEQGEPYLRRALAIASQRFPDTAAMAHLQSCLASLEFNRGHYREAAAILERAIALEERTLGRSHPEVGHTLLCYSAVLSQLHEKPRSEKARREALAILNGNVLSR